MEVWGAVFVGCFLEQRVVTQQGVFAPKTQVWLFNMQESAILDGMD